MEINGTIYCSRCMREISAEGSCPHCGYDRAKEKPEFALDEGTLLNGKYQLGAVIGQGGFGITYAAWDENLDRAVAIKEYFPRECVSRDTDESDEVVCQRQYLEEFLEGRLRFERESHLLASLQDVPNVVQVLDYFSENETAYLVMEYVHGVPLDVWAKDRNLKPADVLSFLRPVMDTLITLHQQGIVHRDLKPDNILVEEDGTACIIDFGAAMQIGQHGSTIILSRGYAPLEQYGSEFGRQGPWSDVYSLAAIYYYLLSGIAPQESLQRAEHDDLKSLSSQRIKIGKKKSDALMSALAVKPEKRTQTMEEFRSRLYNLPLPEVVKQRKRFMAYTISIASILSLAVILLLVNFTFGFNLGDSIYYSLRADGFHIIRYDGHTENVDIPSTRLGIPVVEIEEAAFQGNGDIVQLSISGNVKNISGFAFNDCDNLLTLWLEEGVESLDSHSFSNCISLQAAHVPQSVTLIAEDAFSGCSNRLTLIGERECYAEEAANQFDLQYAQLEMEEVDDGIRITKYSTNQKSASIPDVINGKPVISIGSKEAKSSVFPQTVKSIRLSSNLRYIGDYAFYQCKIKEIQIPDTVVFIGEYAFSQSHLEQIVLPDSVLDVDDCAFSSCVNLRSAKLSAGMTHISDGCFEGAKRLSSISIPEGIEIVGRLAFSKCDELESIRLPESLKRIEYIAFSDSSSLQSIYIPKSVESINTEAFNGCRNDLLFSGYSGSFVQEYAKYLNYAFYDMESHEKSIEINDENEMSINKSIQPQETIELPAFYKEARFKSIAEARSLKSKTVVLPPYIESVKTLAFLNNKELENMILNKSLCNIGTISFAGCVNLQSIEFPESLEKIDDDAFMACYHLSAVKLPSTLQFLGDGVFQYCSEIEEIDIPLSVSRLGNDTFSETGIKEVVIPGNISKCGTAFYGCKALKKVEIQEGVRLLQGSFSYCTSLETVIIPSSVMNISKSTFMGCSALKDIWIYSDSVNMNFTSTSTLHFEYEHDENGINYESNALHSIKTNLDDIAPENLFKDCPDVVLHCYRGSDVEVYATEHNIRYEIIPGEHKVSSRKIEYHSDEPIYSTEELIQMITPANDQNSDYYWNQLNYAYGYAFDNLFDECLMLFEQSGADYDIQIAKSLKLFLNQDKYTTAEFVAFIENFEEHPTVKPGDIIVEVNGTRITASKDRTDMINEMESDTWYYTILRPDESENLEEIEVEVHKKDLRVATRLFTPKTFEENHGM